jgi:hypothetical protein
VIAALTLAAGHRRSCERHLAAGIPRRHHFDSVSLSGTAHRGRSLRRGRRMVGPWVDCRVAFASSSVNDPRSHLA